MDSYTITITPNDDSGNHTTLTVDTSTGHARITSVHLHAPAGLTGGQTPAVDVGLLLQAITGPTHTPTPITATPAAPAMPEPGHAPAPDGPGAADAGVSQSPITAVTTGTPQAAATDTTPPAAATAPAPAPAARSATPGRGAGRVIAGGAAASKNAPSKWVRPGRTQPTPTKVSTRKAAPKRATRKRAAAATAGAGTERVYRRMPDDFAAVYRQASTAAAIADHYGVPRHTAHGWISRHKKQSSAAED